MTSEADWRPSWPNRQHAHGYEWLSIFVDMRVIEIETSSERHEASLEVADFESEAKFDL